MSSSNTDYSKGLVDYTDKDYDALMKRFWEIVPTLTEMWHPEKDTADPGVVLGTWLASVADMLGVNLDWLATEVFAPTVSQRKDAEKIFNLIGYDLGWYTAARTEVTFINQSDDPITFDFGFNGANFCTLNAYTDILGQKRLITYNILPLTNSYGAGNSRSKRSTLTDDINYFVDHDKVTLRPKASVTRVAIEGEIRNYSVSVADVKKNDYIINLPSQHIDTTAVWVRARASRSAKDYLSTQWRQVTQPAEFISPEPLYCVSYDNYSNARIQISSYLNMLDNYDDGTYLTVYWFDCMGVLGSIAENTLSNYLQANPDESLPEETSGSYAISNLSNITEQPHTYTVTGKSPETAKEAYVNSRNYINTWDSLITLPDFERFLRREAGIDTGVVLDCQKCVDINLAIYKDQTLSRAQKQKMYITNMDFPEGDGSIQVLDKIDTSTLSTKAMHRVVSGQTLDEIADLYGVTAEDIADYNNLANVEQQVYPGVVLKIPTDEYSQQAADFTTNFKTYRAMCYAIYNNFENNSAWGTSSMTSTNLKNRIVYQQYKPAQEFINNVIRDYRPLQAMTVELDFGYVRVFNWYVVGKVYTKQPVSKDVGANIISIIKDNLKLYFAPENRELGQKPTTIEIVKVIENSDSRIEYFDAGSASTNVVTWSQCDPDYFNYISFARYMDPGVNSNNIIIASECLA